MDEWSPDFVDSVEEEGPPENCLEDFRDVCEDHVGRKRVEPDQRKKRFFETKLPIPRILVDYRNRQDPEKYS